MKTLSNRKRCSKILLIALFLIHTSFIFSQGITGAGTSPALPLFPGMAADYTFVNTANPTGTVKFFIPNLNGKLYDATTGALLPGGTVFNYNAATVKVIWECGSTPCVITAQHFLASPIPAVYAKTLTVTPLASITQSVSFTKTEMVNSSTIRGFSKKVFMNHCMNGCSPQMDKSLNTTELKLRFNTGSTYNYGTDAFSRKVVVRVAGYPVMNTPAVPSNTVPLFEFDSTLTIDQNTPEELMVINVKSIPNFGSFYPNLNSIDIRVKTYTPSGVTYIDPTLQLMAGYEETYTTTFPNAVAGSIKLFNIEPEYAGSEKIKFKWKWNPLCADGTFHNDNIKPANWVFQVLRLYNYSKSKAIAGIENNITTHVNWDEALTIETESEADSLSLHLTQGSGFYIWRVRPIGDGAPDGYANSINWGPWSYTGNFVQGATNLNANTGTIVQPFGFFYTQPDNDINWIHQRVFGQSDGSGFKLAEGMNYVTGLWQPLQSQTYMQTNSTVLATQMLQDYNGRSKFSSLPAPTGVGYFKYKKAFIQNASGATYSTADFDGNTTYNDPVATNSTCPLASYYSDNNPDKGIPDAEGYPFVTANYSMDGQNLVKEQGNVGSTLRIKPGSATTKKALYGLATEQELIRIFGDEAPANARLQINVDENGNATGSYISKEGKAIANFLVSGATPTPQDLLDPAESYTASTNTYTLNKNTTDDPDGLVSQVDILVAIPGTQVVVNYLITPRSIQADCGTYCATCDYKIDFMMLNADDPSLPPADVTQTLAISSKSCSSQPTVWSYTYTINTPGTWQIKKIIRTNTIDPATGKPYWSKITNLIKSDVKSAIAPYSNALAPYFAADNPDDLDNMNAYLDAQSALPGSGITYNSTTKQYSITPVANACFTVTIPKRTCGETDCPEDHKYAKMLYDMWGSGDNLDPLGDNKDLLTSLANYASTPLSVMIDFPGTDKAHINIKYFFPAWMNMTEDNLDKLIKNMLVDHVNLNTDKICEAWYKTIKSYKSLRLTFDKNDAFPDGQFWKTFGAIDYMSNRKEFNLLEFFFNEPTILKNPAVPIKLTPVPLSHTTCPTYPYIQADLQAEIDYYVRHAYNTVFVRAVSPNILRDLVALQQAANCVDTHTSIAGNTFMNDGYDDDQKDKFCTIFKTYHFTPTTFTVAAPGNSCIASPTCIAAYAASLAASLDTALAKQNLAEQQQEIIDECKNTCEKQALGITLKISKYLLNSPEYVYVDAYSPGDLNNNSNAMSITADQVTCMVWNIIKDCKADCEKVVFPSTPAEIQQFIAQNTYSVLINVMSKELEVSLPSGGKCATGWIGLGETQDNTANLLIPSLNQQLKDFLAANPGYTGIWDVYQAMVNANPNDPGIHTTDCKSIKVTINGYLTPYFVNHKTCDLYYVFYKSINFGSHPVYVKDSVQLCNWICKDIRCPAVCYRWKPFPNDGGLDPIPCASLIMSSIKANYFAQINDIIDDKMTKYKHHYLTTCLDPDNIDIHTATYGAGYYHFTLNYFDRAGNLVKTVPPMGVVFTPTNVVNGRLWHPNHTLFTEYEYNSLGQVIRVKTPDQGESRLYYNSKGMVRFSQNSKQKLDGTYSYTKYDYLGRGIESGLSNQQISGGMPFTVTATLNDNLFPVVANGGVTELVQTYFDAPHVPVSTIPQYFLRNRVAQSISDRDGVLGTYYDQTSVYYSYDAHGNVETTSQVTAQNLNAPCIGKCLGVNTTKHIYDVVSGKILETHYNAGKTDAFYHRYTYDADNRLLTAKTSRDGKLWETDLTNQFYPHGPLKREIIGNNVQGLDYVYTLQGWLKGINHPSLLATNDPGADGVAGSSVCPDIYSEMLGYYKGDFKRTNSPFNTAVANSVYLSGEGVTSDPGLYNGNMSSIVSNMTTPAIASLHYPNLTGNKYRYDKLGRLKSSSFYSFNSAQNVFNYKPGEYSMYLSYDPNGNITHLRRNATAAASTNNQNAMDDLVYSYLPLSNQISKVGDAVGSANYTGDIDNQNTNNYTYYPTGELKTDASAQLSYTWQANGKLKTVQNYLTAQTIDFYYDAMGNRTIKDVHTSSAQPTTILTTYYMYDASGKVVSIYEYNPGATNRLIQTEVPIYGTGRIGVYGSGVIK